MLTHNFHAILQPKHELMIITTASIVYVTNLTPPGVAATLATGW
jgi:hypothetical protein